MKATLFRPDGTSEEVVSKGRTFSLDEMQAFVGGYIELLPSQDGKMVLVVNEEGVLKGLPLNIQATQWTGAHRAYPCTIVGPALLVPSKGIK